LGLKGFVVVVVVVGCINQLLLCAPLVSQTAWYCFITQLVMKSTLQALPEDWLPKQSTDWI